MPGLARHDREKLFEIEDIQPSIFKMKNQK